MSIGNGRNGSKEGNGSAVWGTAEEAARALSTAGTEDGPDEEEYVLGEIPAEIFELSERCRAFVHSALGVELDTTPETLPVLDEYLRMAGAGIADRPELEPLVTRAVAAYYGEVVRSRIDAFWRRNPDPEDPWLLCGRRVFLAVSPLGMVLDSMARGTEHAGPSAELKLAPEDEALARARLEAIPEVSEDEYHLLSTRLEVLELICETLRDQMKSEGRESLVFEEGDYDDE